jgi:hypothetical protein
MIRRQKELEEALREQIEETERLRLRKEKERQERSLLDEQVSDPFYSPIIVTITFRVDHEPKRVHTFTLRTDSKININGIKYKMWNLFQIPHRSTETERPDTTWHHLTPPDTIFTVSTAETRHRSAIHTVACDTSYTFHMSFFLLQMAPYDPALLLI